MRTLARTDSPLGPMIDRGLLGAFVVAFSAGMITTIPAVAQQGWTGLAIGLFSGFGSWLVADLGSGFVHFLADNFGSPSTPIVGPRLIQPFREHHGRPSSILNHDFAERNGNNALIALLLILWIPGASLETLRQQAMALFCLQLGLWVTVTNEIHAMAHQPRVPRWITFLQQSGIILSPEHHRAHHQMIDGCRTNYCITSGVCDRLGSWLFALLRPAGR